jgi:hypothetical protein
VINRAGTASPPVLLNAPKKKPRCLASAFKLQSVSSDLHQILQHRIQAAEHRDLVDLLGDLLQSRRLD